MAQKLTPAGEVLAIGASALVVGFFAWVLSRDAIPAILLGLAFLVLGMIGAFVRNRRAGKRPEI